MGGIFCSLFSFLFFSVFYCLSSSFHFFKVLIFSCVFSWKSFPFISFIFIPFMLSSFFLFHFFFTLSIVFSSFLIWEDLSFVNYWNYLFFIIQFIHRYIVFYHFDLVLLIFFLYNSSISFFFISSFLHTHTYTFSLSLFFALFPFHLNPTVFFWEKQTWHLKNLMSKDQSSLTRKYIFEVAPCQYPSSCWGDLVNVWATLFIRPQTWLIGAVFGWWPW